MPVYDYTCEDGEQFEALVAFDERDAVSSSTGSPCSRIWLSSPSVSIPLHHQSAPAADEHTIQQSKKAAQPGSGVRVREPGMRREAKRLRKERQKSSLKWIDAAVTETIRDRCDGVPE